ncbi:MAG: hypothetical protein RTV72_14240 [Candidatus Thorarchaeota archaeon]
MEDKDLRAVYPIAWVTESSIFNEFFAKSMLESDNDFLISDFASGEYDRVPSFFTRELPKLMKMNSPSLRRTIVYCTDVHALRLDSLLGKLEEADSLSRVRVVQAALEKMDTKAIIRPEIIEYLDNNPDDVSWLDDFLIGEERFPPECFDIGILNNDIVGYMKEYYTEYSNLKAGLKKVHELIRKNGLLIVTMPCSQYIVDNVSVLEESGFEFLQGMDVNISTGIATPLEKDAAPESMSKLGYYTFLLFTRL